MTDPRKMAEIERLGVSLDQAPDVIALQLLDRVNGRVENLSHIFEEEAQRIILFLAKAGRTFYSDIMREVRAANWSTVPTEAADVGDSSAARMQQTTDQIQALVGDRAGGALHSGSSFLNENLGLIVAGSLAGGAGIKAGRWLWRRRGGRGGGGAPGLPGGPGGLLEAAAGPGMGVVRRMTVGTLVVRGGVVGGGGMLGGGPGGKRGRGLGGRPAAAGFGRWLPWLGPGLSLGAGILNLADGDVAGVGGAFGAAAGGALWAGIGATVGSVVPGLGTGLGFWAGSALFTALGGVAGESLMAKWSGWFSRAVEERRDDTPAERRRRRGRRGKRRADAGDVDDVDATADADAESAEPDRPRRSVRWRTRGKRRADAGREEVDATADAEPDKPRRTGRAGVRRGSSPSRRRRRRSPTSIAEPASP